MLWLAVAVLLLHLRRGGQPPADRAPLSARRVAVAVTVVWVVAFGVPTVRAVVYLVRRFNARFVDTGPQLLNAVLMDYLPACLFAVLVLAAVSRRLGTTPARAGLAWPARDRRSVRELLGLTVLCLLMLVVSPGLDVLLPRSGSPWDRTLTPGVHPWFDLDAALSAGRAAIGEELLVVVVPVLLLRAAKVRTRWIVLALLAMRMSYHLYYGWASLDVLLWGSVFLAIYLVRGWIWPQLIAHFVYDTLNGALGPHASSWPWRTAWFVAFVLPLGYLFAARFRLRRARLVGFREWVQAGGLTGLQALVDRGVGERVVTVTAKRYLPLLSQARQCADGTYEVRVGGGVQHMSRAELTAVAAREAAVIRLGHADSRRDEQRADRMVVIMTPALEVVLLVIAAVGIGPRFGATAAGWFGVVVVALLVAWRLRPDTASAARIRARTIVADQAAADVVGEDGVVALLTRVHDLEEPAVDWVCGRGISRRVAAARRIDGLRGGPGALQPGFQRRSARCSGDPVVATVDAGPVE